LNSATADHQEDVISLRAADRSAVCISSSEVHGLSGFIGSAAADYQQPDGATQLLLQLSNHNLQVKLFVTSA
jgi:hypothetical protein